MLDTARRAMTAVPWLLPIVAPLVKAPTLEPAITLTNAHADEARCVCFSPDGRALVSGGRDGPDGTIRWWDLTGWAPRGWTSPASAGPARRPRCWPAPGGPRTRGPCGRPPSSRRTAAACCAWPSPRTVSSLPPAGPIARLACGPATGRNWSAICSPRTPTRCGPWP
ncbi:hypothetical protein FTUN_5505 [Frigoriglobus tundricola]|uniref:WD-40 repeat protein n=1 Tax=Frigoriglobus tundricola TaxID=2774151 RepID=A0A6M5YV60_9BACT|nr:hypothetical protein FTUN_5505 [Frigoriglobus tundricola]